MTLYCPFLQSLNCGVIICALSAFLSTALKYSFEASNEYFKAVDKKALNAQIITPQFKDCKNGQYKVISFYAKKARGMMARYIIENQVTQLSQLKEFTVDGYYYSAEATAKELEPVFLRDERN